MLKISVEPSRAFILAHSSTLLSFISLIRYFFSLFAPCNGAITRVAAANEFFPFFLVSAKVVFSML